MNDLEKRRMLFLLGCIPSRLLIAYVLAKSSTPYLRLFGLILIALSISWFYIYWTGSRKTGVETFGAPIWWNSIRPLHICFYLAAGIMAVRGNKDAFKPIVADTALGLLAFLYHHFYILPQKHK